MQFSESEIVAAIGALNSASPARKEADKYLDKFQKTPGAWQVAGSLILHPSDQASASIFNTLHPSL